MQITLKWENLYTVGTISCYIYRLKKKKVILYTFNNN